MTKTKQENDMTDRIGAPYMEKKNWAIVTDRTECGL